MTAFWLLGTLLAIGVLTWLLRPLLLTRAPRPLSRESVNVSIYRDQLRELEADRVAGTLAASDYERARAELEARMLHDVAEPDALPARAPGRRTALAVGLAVPFLAVALYLAVGNPGAVDREEERAASVAQVEAMVSRLAARLRENPEDVNGWKLLGRSYAVLGRYDESADAYAKAAARAPRDAGLLADFADALAMARGQSLQGEPEKLVLRALEIEPANLKALALAGTAAFERKDFAAAADYWKRMLPHVAPDSEDARAIQQNIAEASAMATAKPAATATVRGTVSLAPQLKEKVSADDTVFVFARAVGGPQMPLAVTRTRVRDLPFRFELDDSMAMTPEMKLSAFPKVVVMARISKSGSATPQPGDLYGASDTVANDASTVEVMIDAVR